jgi:GMP synthase PP-ATPase subunit
MARIQSAHNSKKINKINIKNLNNNKNHKKCQQKEVLRLVIIQTKVNGDVKLVNILMILKVINVQLVEIQGQVLKYKKNKNISNRISKKINV